MIFGRVFQGNPFGGNPSDLYRVKFVHKISPRPDDFTEHVRIPPGAFSNKTELARALRDVGVLQSHERLRSMRVEGEKVVAFPDRGIWHSLTITPEAA